MENDEVFQTGYLSRYKGKLFGLLREREKDGYWEKYLDTLLIELMGFPEEYRGINYYTLATKMATLKFLRFEYFRGTIFECMNLVAGLER